MHNILLVEDEVIIGSSLAFSLKSSGYNVIYPVLNGTEALEIVKTRDIDFILMDINIKGSFDGITTILKIYNVKEIPHIFLSGLTDSNTESRAMKTSPLAYFSKPIDFLLLEKKLADHFKKLD